MKALLVNPETKTVEPIEIGGPADIASHIGYETIISDEIGPGGDRVYLDEDCFLRGSPGRFQVDKVAPISGKAVIAGSADDGATVQDAESDVASVSERITWL